MGGVRGVVGPQSARVGGVADKRRLPQPVLARVGGQNSACKNVSQNVRRCLYDTMYPHVRYNEEHEHTV